MENIIRQILDFWFGSDRSAAAMIKRNKLWFNSSPDHDAYIKQNFRQHVEAAMAGEYMDWCQTAEGRLATILLLDQFTRNIFRKSQRAFDGDDLAQEICLAGLTLGHDKALSIAERSFYYMPLEHCEKLNTQRQAIELFSTLVDESTEEYLDFAHNALNYAKQHHDIIQRFGRFPHRNKVLNRSSTTEELNYLQDNEAAFGQ